MSRILFLAYLFAHSTITVAQNQTNTIRQRTDLADLVVEGRVIQTTAFWNDDHSKIFTSNLIDIYKVFKGDVVGEQIELITEGGVVGSQFSIAMDRPKFTKGVEGVFFCKSRSDLPSLRLTVNPALSPSTIDCFIQYHFEDFNPPASDLTNTYKSIPPEIWDKIVLSSRVPVKHLKPGRVQPPLSRAFSIKSDGPESGTKAIYFTFENVSITNNFQNIAFDVYAHASENGILFGKANVYISYNSEVFGENVVANENITVSKGTIIQNSAYTLTSTDQSEDLLKIEASSSFATTDGAYSLTTVPEQFCHIEVTIENLAALANIGFNAFQMAGSSWYLDPSSLQYIPFDRVVVENPIEATDDKNNAFIHYGFDHICVTQDSAGTYLEFDIVASSDVGWTRLAQADILFGVKESAFGAEPDPEISYTLNPILTSFQYDFLSLNYGTLNGETSEWLFLKQVIHADDSLKHMPIGTSPTLIVHCKMKIKDCAQKAGLRYLREFMEGHQQYYVDAPIPYATYNFGEKDFGEFDQYMCLDSTPIITKIYPLSLRAGVSDILTIEGKYLKQSETEDGTIYFRNSERPNDVIFSPAFKTDIIDYTDTLIRIYVPSDLDTSFSGSAASGRIQVKNALGKSAESTEPIEIIYSILNVRDGAGFAHQISLINADTVNGGYDWFMDDELIGYNPDSCIINALSTWTCLTGINWHLNPVGIVGLDQAIQDGKCTIIYGDDNISPGSTSPSYAYTSIIGHAFECINDIALGTWVVNDIDIVFSKSYTFQHDCSTSDTSGTTVDFYQTLIHELSHAHMLNHVLDGSSIIYTTSTAIYPNPNDIAAGNHAISYSLSWDEGGDCPPHHDTTSCATSSTIDFDLSQSNVRIFPNPFSNEINIELQSISAGKLRISLSTLTGVIIHESYLDTPQNKSSLTTLIQGVSTLPQGIYILTVGSHEGVCTKKLIKK